MRNNRRDRGRLVPQLLGWGTNSVLGRALMSIVVTRMQDLASEFSKIYRFCNELMFALEDRYGRTRQTVVSVTCIPSFSIAQDCLLGET